MLLSVSLTINVRIAIPAKHKYKLYPIEFSEAISELTYRTNDPHATREEIIKALGR